MNSEIIASGNRAAFVIGHPIAHSRSPLLHGFWLKRHSIDGSYTAMDVAPDEISGFLGRIRGGEFIGGNVTLPHKEKVFELADEVMGDAESLGAANTLWMKEGRLCATNTDAYGFLANLDQQSPGWDRDAGTKKALVVGAGGASRSILYALKTRGFSKIEIANRTLSRAEELARDFGPQFSAIGLDSLGATVAGCSLVVNTTSLGMEKHDVEQADNGNAFPGFIDNAPDNALVTDIVYTPLETPLLKRAGQRGLETIDGLGMLLHQAVPGFELWFGVKPKVDDALRNHILASLVAPARKNET